MFHPFMVVYVAVLFFVLTPGVFLSLPARASKMTVAATHAVVFAVVWQLTHKAIWRMAMEFEGFVVPSVASSAAAAALNAKNANLLSTAFAPVRTYNIAPVSKVPVKNLK